MNDIGTALIKFSESEIELLVNSLHMSVSTIVPCVDNGEWKVPYEALKNDLIRINKQLREKKREVNIDIKTDWREPIKFHANPKKEYIDKITGKESSEE